MNNEREVGTIDEGIVAEAGALFRIIIAGEVQIAQAKRKITVGDIATKPDLKHCKVSIGLPKRGVMEGPTVVVGVDCAENRDNLYWSVPTEEKEEPLDRYIHAKKGQIFILQVDGENWNAYARKDICTSAIVEHGMENEVGVSPTFSKGTDGSVMCQAGPLLTTMKSGRAMANELWICHSRALDTVIEIEGLEEFLGKSDERIVAMFDNLPYPKAEALMNSLKRLEGLIEEKFDEMLEAITGEVQEK